MGQMLAICVAAFLVLSPSLAVANYFGAYFEPADEMATCFPQAAWVPFDVYFVLRECPFPSIGGFEFAWDWNLTPPGFSAIVAGIELPPGALNIGTSTNLIVGLAYGLPAAEAMVLARLTILVTTPLSSGDPCFITVGPPTPSSIPHRAAFNDFHDQGHIVPMEFNTWLGGLYAVVLPNGWVDPGVAYVGDCIVPVEASRWGTVKTLFR